MDPSTDPFEARLNFISQLGKLTASQQSVHKVASYAMRYKKLCEDLYSCIIEELEQASINARLNILYVLDSLCVASQKAQFTGYIDLIRRDLPKIVLAVAPADTKGNVNLASTRKVLASWKQKGILPTAEIDEVEKPLLTRDIRTPETKDDTFSKNDILKRMEEDRERHKRLREEIWIRPTEEHTNLEFEQAWHDHALADLDEYDYSIMMAENLKYLSKYPWTEYITKWWQIDIQKFKRRRIENDDEMDSEKDIMMKEDLIENFDGIQSHADKGNPVDVVMADDQHWINSDVQDKGDIPVQEKSLLSLNNDSSNEISAIRIGEESSGAGRILDSDNTILGLPVDATMSTQESVETDASNVLLENPSQKSDTTMLLDENDTAAGSDDVVSGEDEDDKVLLVNSNHERS